MRANREFTVSSEQRTLEVRRSVMERVYDAQMPGFSTDGAWDHEGDRRDPLFAQGTRDIARHARRQGALHRQVRSGPVLTDAPQP